MIYIVRIPADQATRLDRPNLRVVLRRRTPAQPGGGSPTDQVDLFCVGEEATAEGLRADGWKVVAVHDGWYADDAQGGVAIWGQGRYWEVRPTPFEVTQSG